MHREMAKALETVVLEIKSIQENARESGAGKSALHGL
jgi:phosphoketolase